MSFITSRRKFVQGLAAAVILAAGLIKPTSTAGDWGHFGYQPIAFAPNQTYKDFTCDFDKADPNTGLEQA